MTAQAGDLIVVESERITQSVRRGVIEEVLDDKPPRFRIRWGRRPYQHLHPVRRGGENREAEEGAEGLTPAREEAVVLFGHLGPERRAGFAEASPYPREVAPVGEARVRELQLERDRFQPASIEIDEEKQTEVIPQLRVDRVIVEEVTEVVEDAAVEAVEEVRRVAGDQCRAGLQQRPCGGPNMCGRLVEHVRTPVRGDDDRIRGEPP